MADIEIVLGGPKEFVEQLEAFTSQFPSAVERGAWEELSDIMNESKKICPVDFNPLRASGYVSDSVVMADGTILISVGYSSEYAVYVHEILTNHHNPPTQAKFLEQPLVQRVSTMVRNIVLRVNRIIGGGA